MTVTISKTYDGDLIPQSVTLLTLTLNSEDVDVSPAVLPDDFTQADADTFTYEFEGTSGNTYAFTYRLTFTGGATVDRAGTITAAGTATGHYATQADVEDWYGRDNIQIWSQLDNDYSAADTDRISRFLEKADRFIDARIGPTGRTVPVPDTESDFEQLTDVAAEWAGAKLYMARGVTEEGSDLDARMQAHVDHAEAELARLIGVWNAANDGTPPAGTFQFVPITRGMTCTDYDF
jgi:hypothetical protein